jgi:3-isopropylmalate/(R)-2-methylmalate dehydratase small subunit
MLLKGKVFKFGNDINTDEIIPARYLNTSNFDELASHCMEDADKDFVKKMSKGDIIMAEKNFGCGSSREHAPISIKIAGVSCVIAKSFARIFYRNALNIGLPILESTEAVESTDANDVLEIDLAKGEIKNITKNKTFQSTPFPEFMQELIKAGGLLDYVTKE